MSKSILLERQGISRVVFFILVVFGLHSCKNDGLPNGFRSVTPDAEKNEILAAKYKDQMLILVSDDASKRIKNSSIYGPLPLKQMIESKFIRLKSKFDGYNETELDNYKVEGQMYMYKTFDFEKSGSDIYYELGGVYIKDPEEYYELYISGDRSNKKSHRKHITAYVKYLIDYNRQQKSKS